MAPDASIQSFYLPSSSPVKPVPLPPSSGLKDLPSTDSGDGRSPYQVHRTFARSWVPQKDYIKADISTLTPGSQSTKLTARIVNFHEHSPRAKAPYGAQGCIRFILKDDTGAITVRFSFPHAVRGDPLTNTRCICGLPMRIIGCDWATSSASGPRTSRPVLILAIR